MIFKNLFKRESSKQKDIPIDDVNNDIEPVINEKPQICLFDLNTNIEKAFKENQYNVTSGSIGQRVDLPVKNNNDNFFLKLNSNIPENLHEYDIIVMDLLNDKRADYEKTRAKFKNITGKKTYAILCSYPETVFNPIPFSINLLMKKIESFKEKESVIIIFASENESVEYHTVEIGSNGYNINNTYNYSSTNVYIDFPSNFNKYGKKMLPPVEATKLNSLLLKYLNDSYYSIVFNHPKEWINNKPVKSENFIPLLLNQDNEIVSYCHAFNDSFIFVFPQLKDKKSFLIEFFNNYLTDIKPNLFPYHGQFGWLDNGEYPLPGELSLKEKKTKIEDDYINNISEINSSLEKLKVDYSFLRDLISETGDKLVSAIQYYLEWLGFKSVINLDETNPNVLEEDLQVDHEGKFLVIEIKGLGGTSTDKDCSQISKIKYRRAEERGKFDVYGLYIVNHQRYISPQKRKNPPFTDNQLNDAKLDKRGLLTTYELYNSYFKIEQKIITKEEVRNQLFNVGLIEFSPLNLTSLGIPEEFFSGNTVVIVNLDNITISIGDYIYLKKNNEYSKLKVSSLQFNGKNLDTVSSGEVGIKLEGKVKKNTELFIKKG